MTDRTTAADSAGGAMTPDRAGSVDRTRSAPTRMTAAIHPVIYEINTWPWLRELSESQDRPVDLGSVPDAAWDEIASLGVDAVWLMGVWRRSPAGIDIAIGDPVLTSSFSAALPDWRPEDVVGSPYCVRDYRVDEHLGGPDGLATARRALAERGVGLILDFVPNHVAPDHPWVLERGELFVTGTAGDLLRDPSSFIQVGDRVLAKGRDPYFPAWPDVVQLNAFAAALRETAIETLTSISEQCDGVRCDMAMLMLNDVFARTWGDRVGPPPPADYWPTIIPAVHAHRPDFLFIAEAYWDLEWVLQQQGFDFCYDKRLYDRLQLAPVDTVHGHLTGDSTYQQHLVRFVENHDEPRVAAAFGDRARVVAVAALTQCGARLIHHGQLCGRRTRLPVFLGRFPAEPIDQVTVDFYLAMMDVLDDPTFHRGLWQLADLSGWPGSRTENLVAWCWRGDHTWLIVVNLGDQTASGRVRFPVDSPPERWWLLVDPTHGVDVERSGHDLIEGLYVELQARDWHLWRMDAAADGASR